MFPESTEPELEAGFLRSGRRFQSGKRRKIVGGRWTTGLIEEGEYEVESWLDKGYCNEEEEYILISEGAEDSEETAESPRSGCQYITPEVSPEVRSRASSPKRVVNTDSASTVTSTQEIPPSLNHSLEKPDANSMAGEDIKLPTFNGNGA